MPRQIVNTAGTVTLRSSPGILEHVLANGTVYGKVDIYDRAGTATLGTANLAWSYTFSGNDVTTGKNLNLQCSNSIVAVLASNQQTFFQWQDGSKR